jgi:hypothetical protein
LFIGSTCNQHAVREIFNYLLLVLLGFSFCSEVLCAVEARLGVLGRAMNSEPEPESAASKYVAQINQRTQILLDKSAPHVTGRWIGWLVAVLIYAARVWFLRGFYIVTYGLGIYNLNLLLGFITPQIDPEQEEGPQLPTKNDQEFKPFVRRLPEFKFW